MQTVIITSPTLQNKSWSMVRFVIYLPIPMAMCLRSGAFLTPGDAGQVQCIPMNFHGLLGFPGKFAAVIIVQIIWGGCSRRSQKNFMDSFLKS